MDKMISKKNLPALCRKLAGRDEHLALIFENYGPPPLWRREPSFATLIHIILEQQVSLASARAAFDRLQEKTGEITPANLLALSESEMRACYFSRQKTVYARELARAVLSGQLRLAELPALPDEEVRAKLTGIKGIGPWTADIFLLMALLRPDVMPRGDLALHAAWQKIRGLSRRPTADEFIRRAEQWSPLRSVAARLLWHFYLCTRAENKNDL